LVSKKRGEDGAICFAVAGHAQKCSAYFFYTNASERLLPFKAISISAKNYGSEA